MGIAVGFAFVVIVGALVAAGVVMVRSGRGGRAGSKEGAMMRALAVRIGVSIALFLCLLVAWRMGWISPTGLR